MGNPNFKLNLTFLMLRRFSNFNKTNNTKSFFRNFVYQRTDKPSVFRIINFYDTDHRLSLNQVSPTFYKNEDDSYSLSRSGLIFLNISYPMSIEQTIQLVLSDQKEKLVMQTRKHSINQKKLVMNFNDKFVDVVIYTPKEGSGSGSANLFDKQAVSSFDKNTEYDSKLENTATPKEETSERFQDEETKPETDSETKSETTKAIQDNIDWEKNMAFKLPKHKFGLMKLLVKDAIPRLQGWRFEEQPVFKGEQNFTTHSKPLTQRVNEE